MPDFAKELNPEQLDVVLHGDGPCLVLAGAGSGKTRVITYRVAYLLERGVNPENILLVTFTNKAAGEMVRRVGALTRETTPYSPPSQGGDSQSDSVPVKRLPWAGTFHHIAYKILRLHGSVLGYGDKFTILDSDDSESLIKICAKQYKNPPSPAGYGGQSPKFPSAKVLQNIISFARNAGMAIDEVLDLKYPQWLFLVEQIKNIADDYAKKKKEGNVMDFDDLLVNFLLLLNHPDTLSLYAGKFKYVLVDEYQDTNKIQASIIDKLASVHRNILVVGDDAQSIYSFRAADIANILQFSAQGGPASGGEKKYPDAKIFYLTTNYRSSQEILDLANNVISNNTKQYKKVLKTLEASGVKPELQPRMDQASEAEFVVKKIQSLLDDGVPYKEIAVLFRAAYHSQMLEMQLVRAGIAYDYRGGLRFFERAHVKDILSYLRIMNNLADTTAWYRILMHEDGIGPAAAQKIIEAVRQLSFRAEPEAKSRNPLALEGEGIPPLAASLGRNDKTDDYAGIASIGFGVLGERAKEGWSNFVKIWNELLQNKNKEPSDMIRIILGSAYGDYLETEYVDAEERMRDLEQLAVFAEKYGDLTEFLAEATLQESFNLRGATPPLAPPQRGGDNVSPSGRGRERGGEDKIVLSTIHQAKGLEWHSVFLLNLSSGGFPNDRALRERDGIEEERRLFYVAITRAKRNLVLTYPMASGGAGDFLSGPSMFLSEISEGLLDDHSLLNYNTTILDDDDADVHYVNEDAPPKITPGSFLRDLEDL
ncbi:MAG: ATP-dependent helicase [bacterium]|nr:ATP-dependent helicase [bacterium]